MRARRTIVTSTVVLLMTVIAVPGLDAATRECFGKRVTMRVPNGGAQQFTGTPENDVIYGTPGFDTIDGGGGNDRICSLGGADIVWGGHGNDRLSGGSGKDTLIGDSYNPNGPASNDPAAGADTINGGPGFDTIVGDSYARNGDATGGGHDVLNGGKDFATIFGDSFADTSALAASITAEGGGSDDIVNGSANVVGDSFARSEGGSAIATGSGPDDIRIGPGTLVAVGDSRASGSTTSTASGTAGQGQDGIFGSSDGETIVGDHLVGNSPVATGAAIDFIRGKGGPDLIFGDSADAAGNSLSAAGEFDEIFGGRGNDRIQAGPGDDDMDGGRGTDECHGEDGDDAAFNCEVVT